MFVLPWEMCFSHSPPAWVAFCMFSHLLLLVVFVHRLVATKHQGGKPEECQCSGNEGSARGSVTLQPSQPPKSQCSPASLEVGGECEPDHWFSCTVEDLIRSPDMVDWEKLEDTNNSETSSMAREVRWSSRMSLTCWRDDSPDAITMGDVGPEDTLGVFFPEMTLLQKLAQLADDE